ncbi:MAG: class I SAM-dependent methyltransferase [Chloroflexi bacterium CFX6]|nr:class I SAM-dependent methyltransferase [Chloroflexi bacterium CFX6]
MSAGALYDSIGHGYARGRRPDPRIAAQLAAALGDARSVLNVGAGAGSYEPPGRRVVAVEPSAVMLAQRPRGAASAVQARAEALPFPDRAFDATMAILTLHHWADRAGGLAECARVARRSVVLLTWDTAADTFWLHQDYFPELAETDREVFPPMAAYAEAFGPGARVAVVPVPVPRDCVDGFLGAYWARPAAYLDPTVRAGMSSFARPDTEPGLARLRSDLATGAWNARHGHLLAADALDVGYRLVVAHLPVLSVAQAGLPPER